MSILFVNASPNPRGTTARLAAQLLAGKSYDTIELGVTKVYDYGQTFDDDRFAIDAHHASPMMQKLAQLRDKYDLHMQVRRYADDDTMPESDHGFIRQ